MSEGKLKSLEKCFFREEMVEWRRKCKWKGRMNTVNGGKEKRRKEKKKKKLGAKLNWLNQPPKKKIFFFFFFLSFWEKKKSRRMNQNFSNFLKNKNDINCKIFSQSWKTIEIFFFEMTKNKNTMFLKNNNN